MDKEQLKRRIDVASKRIPADVVIKGGQIVDVFNLQLKTADIAICDGVIVGIGDYEGKEVINAEGRFIAPSFIDGHVHIESSMVTPKEFAKAVLPHGVTTVITDPHEIANVSGTEGISFMLEDSEGIPLDVLVNLPSCVPATSFENAGAVLHNEHLLPFYEHPRVVGLAEVMDFPSVKFNEEKMMDKLVAAANYRNHIDGHFSGFDEDGVNIYRAAGIKTDHESVSKEEIEMRISRGVYVLIREGTTTKDLIELIPMVTPYNARRFLFCTDDKHIDDLLFEGSIDYNIRLAIDHGMDPLQAIQLATLNAAECFSLTNKGAVAPGYTADLVILEDLQTIKISKVLKAGKLVAENGKLVIDIDSENKTAQASKNILNSVHIKDVTEKDLQIYLGKNSAAHIIETISNQVVTKDTIANVETKNGFFIPSVEKDLLKLAVIERHRETGNIGLGIVKGLGLKSGAIASTVAHDSHNLVVAGTNDADMLLAVEEIKTMQGGLVVISEGKVLGKLELAISGLISIKPYNETLTELKSLNAALSEISAIDHAHTFITLSFLSLPVIPALKLTDQGLFDVTQFKHILIQA